MVIFSDRNPLSQVVRTLPKRIVITNPSQPGVANGNLTTALRWQSMLSHAYHVDIINPSTFVEQAIANHYDLMIGIHCTRSSQAANYWAKSKGGDGNINSLIMALSGTDLYLDYPNNQDTQISLELAAKLIVLQDVAPKRLTPQFAKKCEVIFQSCESLPTVPKPASPIQVVMVGHLRDVKDPLTYIRAAEHLSHRNDIQFTHLGQSLDDNLATAATEATRRLSNYRWLGEVSASKTREVIQHAHVLVHASKQEGGAHVIMEAVTSGTPVIASKMDGNIGMLGNDYSGYFAVGNFIELAELIERMADPLQTDWINNLKQSCQARAGLFAPEHESAQLNALVAKQLAK